MDYFHTALVQLVDSFELSFLYGAHLDNLEEIECTLGPSVECRQAVERERRQ